MYFNFFFLFKEIYWDLCTMKLLPRLNGPDYSDLLGSDRETFLVLCCLMYLSKCVYAICVQALPLALDPAEKKLQTSTGHAPGSTEIGRNLEFSPRCPWFLSYPSRKTPWDISCPPTTSVGRWVLWLNVRWTAHRLIYRPACKTLGW